MYDFNYKKASSIDEAVAAVTGVEEGKFMSGGMTLIPTLKQRLAKPSDVVDLGGIDELSGITVSGGTVSIGAMTRHAEVHYSADVKGAIPALAKLAGLIGDPMVRNRGTIGGSIAHADPAAELPAVLAVLGGKVTARSVRGERDIPASDLFTFHFTTSLEPDELLTEVWFPSVPATGGSAFIEVSRRHGDYALAGAACVVENGSCRLAFTGVGPTPVLVASDDPDAAAAAVSPADDIHATADYRRQLVRVLTTRAAAKARERAGVAT
jgi:CO/xanthine dehydrogenase FAD-binding subunit